MGPSITLIGRGKYGEVVHSLTLPLSTSRFEYSIQDTLEIVYQDISYEYRITGLDLSLTDADVRITINNKDIALTSVDSWIEDEAYSISFKSDGNKPPFLLIYGITDIIVSFELSEEKMDIFFSSYLAVAIQERGSSELESSVVSMLDDIYQKDHHLLYSDKLISKDGQPNLLRFGENRYEEETSFLTSLIQTLHKLLPNFLTTPRTKLKTEIKIDSFEKLHTVGTQNLIYIATHPEHLRPSTSTFGISVGKRRLFPEKTLVSTNTFSYDTVENRSVLSFIYTVLGNCEQRKQDIIHHLSMGSYDISVNGNLREDYIISASVIYQYTKIAFQKYLKEYEGIVEQLSDIFSQYQRALSCHHEYLTHPPSPTPAFLEMQHYRKIFELMNIWFGRSDTYLPSRNPLLHFSSADAIYEYYCLLHICDILVELGFEEEIERRSRYQYSVRGSSVFKNTEIDNTYYFNKENCKVTLYYQPVIYSYKSTKTNDINLFRTDWSYYSPDFILKKEDDTGVVKYGILDAKWRKGSDLLKHSRGGELPDMVYKYLYSILNTDSRQPVPFLWLMHGKDENGIDHKNEIYFHRRGKMSELMQDKLTPREYREFKYATGIVPLTPTSGTNGLFDILQVFLS